MNRPWIFLLPFVFLSILHAQEDPPAWPILKKAPEGEPLPGTELLTSEGDLSHQLVSANDKFLDEQIAAAREARTDLWKPGSYDPEKRRTEFAAKLGLDRDDRAENIRFEYYSTQKAQVAVAEGLAVYSVRWQAIDGVQGDGLLLEPSGEDHPTLADVIAIPDADQSPEELAGLTEGETKTPPVALLLAQAGCRVLIPTIIHREEKPFKMTRREWLHRPAFELGRHLLGYELHQIFAGLDALQNTVGEDRPIGIIGWGEGGLLALYAAALDPRIDAACVSGYFGPREDLWKEPAEHNIFGLLNTFGDAELVALVSPRPVVIEFGNAPTSGFRASAQGELEQLNERAPKSGKPGRFQIHTTNAVETELKRARAITAENYDLHPIRSATPFSEDTLSAFAHYLPLPNFDPAKKPITYKKIYPAPDGQDPIAERQDGLAAAIERHTQRALIQSRQDRQTYFSDLKTDTMESFKTTIEAYRERFRTEVVGDFEIPLVDPAAQSRPYEVGPKTISYEVVLDIYDGAAGDPAAGDPAAGDPAAGDPAAGDPAAGDPAAGAPAAGDPAAGDPAAGAPVFAYGILTLPKDFDITSGEKRPVVVCQHGLEGTPQDVIGEAKYKAYSAFATRLAERGYITFAPQNGYKYFDLFRMQQFKAQSIGKTLFSLIVPKHQQITKWLADQPFVDPDRIAFYGLSYGGKSAMRIPPLVDRYCLSICSADFNEWVWKNAATDPKSLRYSYANKGEYEIFEWNLGGTFNYAEMAALICPRPFMVERGHFDGVAPDEMVGYEFAKVRNLYQAKLGIGDRCEIEWFVGPHSINGVGTYQFLDKHLGLPKPKRNGPSKEVRDNYKSLSDEQRTELQAYIRDVMNNRPNLSRERRGEMIREAMEAISKGEKPEPIPEH